MEKMNNNNKMRSFFHNFIEQNNNMFTESSRKEGFKNLLDYPIFLSSTTLLPRQPTTTNVSFQFLPKTPDHVSALNMYAKGSINKLAFGLATVLKQNRYNTMTEEMMLWWVRWYEMKLPPGISSANSILKADVGGFWESGLAEICISGLGWINSF